MADVEDIIQVKNDSIAGIGAPLMVNYPDGYVDSLKLPMSLTWVMQTSIDKSGTIAIHSARIDVFVQPLAQGNYRTNKKQAKDLRDLFIAEYSISAANAIILVVSNPVDVLTYVTTKVSGLPWQRVVASAWV